VALRVCSPPRHTSSSGSSPRDYKSVPRLQRQNSFKTRKSWRSFFLRFQISKYQVPRPFALPIGWAVHSTYQEFGSLGDHGAPKTDSTNFHILRKPSLSPASPTARKLLSVQHHLQFSLAKNYAIMADQAVHPESEFYPPILSLAAAQLLRAPGRRLQLATYGGACASIPLVIVEPIVASRANRNQPADSVFI
jgi:hypothetical protein